MNIDMLKIWEFILNGNLSDFVFIDVVGNTFKVIENNFLLLWAFAKAWVIYSEKTKPKWDDKWSKRFLKFLTGFRDRGFSSTPKTVVAPYKNVERNEEKS